MQAPHSDIQPRSSFPLLTKPITSQWLTVLRFISGPTYKQRLQPSAIRIGHLGGNMNTLFGKVIRIVLILAVLVGAGTLLIAAGNSNESSVASSPASPLSPTKVGPQKVTSVLMVYDSDSNGFGGSADMIGPEIGSIKYQQNNSGGLNLGLHTDFAQPNTTYQVFLTCGPSHALACG